MIWCRLLLSYKFGYEKYHNISILVLLYDDCYFIERLLSVEKVNCFFLVEICLMKVVYLSMSKERNSNREIWVHRGTGRSFRKLRFFSFSLFGLVQSKTFTQLVWDINLEYQGAFFAQHKKCPYSEFFWSIYSHIWSEYSVLSIQSECGKIRTRKTPNTEIFHGLYWKWQFKYWKRHLISKSEILSKGNSLK